MALGSIYVERDEWNALERRALAAEARASALEVERDEAISAQFTVDSENGVAVGWDEVAAIWKSRVSALEAFIAETVQHFGTAGPDYMFERAASALEEAAQYALLNPGSAAAADKLAAALQSTSLHGEGEKTATPHETPRPAGEGE